MTSEKLIEWVMEMKEKEQFFLDCLGFYDVTAVRNDNRNCTTFHIDVTKNYIAPQPFACCAFGISDDECHSLGSDRLARKLVADRFEMAVLQVKQLLINELMQMAGYTPQFKEIADNA